MAKHRADVPVNTTPHTYLNEGRHRVQITAERGDFIKDVQEILEAAAP